MHILQLDYSDESNNAVARLERDGHHLIPRGAASVAAEGGTVDLILVDLKTAHGFSGDYIATNKVLPLLPAEARLVNLHLIFNHTAAKNLNTIINHLQERWPRGEQSPQLNIHSARHITNIHFTITPPADTGTPWEIVYDDQAELLQHQVGAQFFRKAPKTMAIPTPDIITWLKENTAKQAQPIVFKCS